MAISTEQAWAEMSGKLRGYFRRRVSDEHLADDLVQETFLRIHNGIRSLKDDERLAAWVYRIAHNTLLDHFRKGAASKEVLTDEIVVPENPPESNYNEEVGDCLREMVQNLPSTYRRAVEMAELEGATQREVGERLGISVSGAKSRVQRGREKLKELLLDCCHVELDRRSNVAEFQQRAGCQSECGPAPLVALDEPKKP